MTYNNFPVECFPCLLASILTGKRATPRRIYRMESRRTWPGGDSCAAGHRQGTGLYIYHFIFLSTSSLVYLSIIVYPTNTVPFPHSLARLAWQVHLYTIKSIFLGLLAQLLGCSIIFFAVSRTHASN